MLKKDLVDQGRKMDEEWVIIPQFTKYLISSYGRIFNRSTEQMMRTSLTPFGHVKISLQSEVDKLRYTRSVALLVAEAFVEPPNPLCSHIILLDGKLSNVAAYNIVWRPAWYSWKYTHQLKVPQPMHYHNLSVTNISTNIKYKSIIEAGMAEGLLFIEIWASTYTGKKVFPYGHVFEISERV